MTHRVDAAVVTVRGRCVRAAVVVAAVLAWTVGTAPAPGAQEAPDAPVGAAATISTLWTRTVSDRAVSTSSPVLVDNGGTPLVAVADTGGNVRAYRLSDGSPVSGWGSVSVGFGVRAPLSSDGTNVYVPVAQDGKARYPRYRKFSPSGQLLWDSNPSLRLPSSGGFLLSGLSLARVDGAWRGVGGSSGHWIHGVDASNGAERWRFRNADSTMATPALADLYGAGRPQVITSNDTTAEFPWDRHGGILRILTADGDQICSATQLVSGSTYASSGYNNSSPVVAEVGGRPLIVFGSTGPRQSGAGGNQVVAYDEACRLKWASPALAAQVQPSPTLADVRGTGGLQVVQVVGVRDGANTYPRVYVLDAATGAVVDDTGSSLRGDGASLAYPPSVQVTTADVDGDGAQDLFVPAKQGRYLILDGTTLEVMARIPTNMAVQNTPVLSQEAGGVRVTMAGYNAAGGIVSSYLVHGAQLGERGWSTFGGNAQRTGLQGGTSGPRDQLLEGHGLPSGGVLRARAGGATATMQTDGNFVLRRGDGSVRWQTRTSVAGSTLLLRADGQLVVRSPGGATLWSSGARGFGTERLVLGTDGLLRTYTGYWTATRRLTTTQTVWISGARAYGDRLQRGQALAPGASLVSKDGTHRVTMQIDGNLVFLRGRKVLWHSRTQDGSGQAYARLLGDGNLVVVGAGDRLLFSAGVGGRGGVMAVAESDGEFRVNTAAGNAVWRNGVVK